MRCARLHSVRQELPGGGLLLRLHLGVDALAVPVAAISASSAAVAALTAALTAALATSALAAALASTAARHAAAFTSATATVHAQSR